MNINQYIFHLSIYAFFHHLRITPVDRVTSMFVYITSCIQQKEVKNLLTPATQLY